MLPSLLPRVPTPPDETSLTDQRFTTLAPQMTVPDDALDLCKAGVRGSIPLVSTHPPIHRVQAVGRSRSPASNPKRAARVRQRPLYLTA